jgi:protein SCO1/2
VNARLSAGLMVPVTIAAVLLGLLVWLVWDWRPSEPPGTTGTEHRRLDLASPPTGGDFRLTSANGPVSLADFRGKVVLIYFGYTWCPDICPTNLAIIAYGLKQLSPEERGDVQVLFVSVDPERDDPARLAEYAAYFDPGILGVTGSDDEVAAVAGLYGAAYRRTEQVDSAMGYLVDHSSYTYLVDAEGKLVEALPHATSSERIVERIRELLGGPMASG